MENVSTVHEQRRDIEALEDPPFERALFGEVRWAWVWLILRLYAGYEWFSAGLEKVQSPAWVGPTAGAAITGFVKGALTKSSGDHPDVQGWYATFLQNVVLPNAALFSRLVAYGELLVGIALILGLFTGIAAFFGSIMNANYLLSGTVSTNPILLTIAILLILAWKTAGWWGLDRWVLPALGTPWRPGKLFRSPAPVTDTTANAQPPSM
jgi:thiosulfate dehydrogenase [quinone] large subunit